ncbi:MAG: hypothetical protein JST54_20605 [Deltaproteobacteria bacterium]|nr:hypothetical protein [Deltaproteobacteria bacterium]
MALDLKQLEQEFAAAPLTSPYSRPLTLAVLSDTYRLAGRAPPSARAFDISSEAVWDKLGVLAHLLNATGLRDESVRGLRAHAPSPDANLAAFLEAVEPLTAEMIRGNIFRREELVRRWLLAVSGDVAGETAAQSQARLEQLDYRKTLREYEAAEKARAAESERRAKLLREAQEREMAARGWRE